jgi:hypothetical protein
MRPTFAYFFGCAVFLSSPGVVRAEPPERGAAAAPPQAGQTVTIDADAAAFDWRGALREVSVRVGDPDDDRFELDCQTAPPFTVRVLGGFESTVVLRYETTERPQGPFFCKNGGVITISLNGWEALKKAEAGIAAAKAAKERRRATIRDIVKGATPEKVK